jgi:vacuolar-type H+-ATPase subunit D/Vma8
MKNLSTICEAHRHAHYLARKSGGDDYALLLPEEKETLIRQLLEIIDVMHDMGERMERRLKEYYDFVTEFLEAGDQLMED